MDGILINCHFKNKINISPLPPFRQRFILPRHTFWLPEYFLQNNLAPRERHGKGLGWGVGQVFPFNKETSRAQDCLQNSKTQGRGTTSKETGAFTSEDMDGLAIRKDPSLTHN